MSVQAMYECRCICIGEFWQCINKNVKAGRWFLLSYVSEKFECTNDDNKQWRNFFYYILLLLLMLLIIIVLTKSWKRKMSFVSNVFFFLLWSVKRELYGYWVRFVWVWIYLYVYYINVGLMNFTMWHLNIGGL